MQHWSTGALGLVTGGTVGLEPRGLQLAVKVGVRSSQLWNSTGMIVAVYEPKIIIPTVEVDQFLVPTGSPVNL